MFPITKAHLIAGGIVASVVLTMSGCAYINHLRDKADQARPAIATAKALDQLAITTQQNQEKADDAVNAIREAPGAEQPMSPDVLARHRDGIKRLRDHKRPR